MLQKGVSPPYSGRPLLSHRSDSKAQFVIECLQICAGDAALNPSTSWQKLLRRLSKCYKTRLFKRILTRATLRILEMLSHRGSHRSGLVCEDPALSVYDAAADP